jgi:hypothetical protein
MHQEVLYPRRIPSCTSNQHDLPALLEALKSTFDELAELDVATEYKMHPDLFLKTTMRIIRPYMNGVHNLIETYT